MSDTPTNGWRPKHLSHSAIERWAECPRKYYDSYVKRSPFAASRAMLIGTLFGKLIEDVHGRKPRVEGDEARTALQLHFQNLRISERALVDDAALDIVYRMFDLYRSRDGGPYDVEPEFEFLVYLPDRARVPYPIKGFMDGRSKDKPFILEAKTSGWMDHPKWGWTQHRVNSSPQAALYWYYDYSQHQRDSDVQYILFGYGDRGVSMRELSTRPDMGRVEEIQDEAARLCAAIEAEEFPCLCGKCKVAA